MTEYFTISSLLVTVGELLFTFLVGAMSGLLAGAYLIRHILTKSGYRMDKTNRIVPVEVADDQTPKEISV